MALRIKANTLTASSSALRIGLWLDKAMSFHTCGSDAAIWSISFSPGGVLQKIVRHGLHQGECHQMRQVTDISQNLVMFLGRHQFD